MCYDDDGGYDGFGRDDDYNIFEENQIAMDREFDDFDPNPEIDEVPDNVDFDALGGLGEEDGPYGWDYDQEPEFDG